MKNRWVPPKLALILLSLSVFVFGQELPSGQLASIVKKLEQAQSVTQPRSGYEVIREYRFFGADNSCPSSEVTARLDYRPPDQKTYVIQKRSGNSRGEQVVKRILDHEAELAAHDSSSAAVLTTQNYDFSYLGERTDFGKRYFLLGLQPKRKDKDLVSGTAWVDENSFLVRHIEGELARSPSWWIKKVHVSIDFADIAGAWQQARMEAVADVRLIGTQVVRSQTVADAGTTEAQARQRRRSRDIPAELLLLRPDKRR